MIAFRTFWLSCKDFFEDMFLSIFANVVWCILVIPLGLFAYQNIIDGYYVGAAIITCVIFVTFTLANGALAYVARRIVDGMAVSWRDLWTGARSNLRKRMVVHAIWCGILVTCIFNIWFYSTNTQIPTNIAIPLVVLFFDLTVLWLAYLAFLLPVLTRQPDSSIGVILRNAAGLMFTNVFGTLTMLVIGSMLCVASALVLILFLFFFVVIMALWSTHMTDAAIKVVLDRQAALAASSADGSRVPSGQVRPEK